MHYGVIESVIRYINYRKDFVLNKNESITSFLKTTPKLTDFKHLYFRIWHRQKLRIWIWNEYNRPIDRLSSTHYLFIIYQQDSHCAALLTNNADPERFSLLINFKHKLHHWILILGDINRSQYATDIFIHDTVSGSAELMKTFVRSETMDHIEKFILFMSRWRSILVRIRHTSKAL